MARFQVEERRAQRRAPAGTPASLPPHPALRQSNCLFHDRSAYKLGETRPTRFASSAAFGPVLHGIGADESTPARFRERAMDKAGMACFVHWGGAYWAGKIQDCVVEAYFA
jgi:hypothetical protein